MATLRACVLILLMLSGSSAETTVPEPVVCYMLDGFLLVYCIVFTALFFRQRLTNNYTLQLLAESLEDSKKADGANEENYEELNTTAGPSGARPKQRTEASGDTYQVLQRKRAGDASDEYQELKPKARKKKPKAPAEKKEEKVYEALTPETKSGDTYGTLAQRPAASPPPPTSS